MKKLIKILLIINIPIDIFFTAWYVQAESNDPRNGFNGLLFFWPMLVGAISLVILAIAAFVHATVKATPYTPKVVNNNQRYKNIGLCLAATILPMLLLYFSMIGENRNGLKILATIGIVVCLGGVIFNLMRSRIAK